MKSLMSYCVSLLLLGSLFLATSCGEEEVVDLAAPTVALGGDDAVEDVFEVGDKIDLLFTFTAPAQISSFNYTVTVDGTDQPKVFVNPADIPNLASSAVEGSIPFSLEVPQALEGAEVSILFEVVDKEGDFATTVFDFVVETAVDAYTAILLGGQYHATEQSFYNAIDNAEYMYAAAKENANKVDFLYYYGTSGDNPVLNTLAAPTNERAKTAFEAAGVPLPATMDNKTVFVKLPAGTKFEDLRTSADLENAFNEVSSPQNIVSNLAVGELVAFKLDTDRGGRFGVIKINKVSAPDDKRETRTIELDVKVQSENN